MKEAELFPPIHEYLTGLGYTLDGEVKDIDMFGVRDGQSIVIELKNQLNLKVITQSALRQKICDTVYVGIWMPKNLREHGFKDKVYLLKRLGIGLILVSPNTYHVEIYHEPVIHPIEEYQRRQRKKKKRIMNEWNRRKTHMNVGGVTHKKIITGYKEEALAVLDYLASNEPVTVASVLEGTGIKRSGTILQKNYYEWFHRVQRGVYERTELGKEACETYADVIKKLREMKR